MDRGSSCVCLCVRAHACVRAGRSLVVPISTGCKFAVASLVHTPAPAVRLFDGTNFTPECDKAIREIHYRIDEDLDGVLERCVCAARVRAFVCWHVCTCALANLCVRGRA